MLILRSRLETAQTVSSRPSRGAAVRQDVSIVCTADAVNGLGYSKGSEVVKRLGGYAAHLWMPRGDRLLVGGPCPGQISLLGEQVSEEDHGHRCQFRV
jgi:hypothetical protein